MSNSCDNQSSVFSPLSTSDKLKWFLSTGSATPQSEYRWRTLPAMAKGISGTIEQVLAGIKESPSDFEVRLGRRGDLYVAQA